eukprot:TRINITY_DN177_c1_g1_i1.p1 TRINITY_DN177_c1_g1~~TRINITY_DN177_c1_g1_i1.p1  ORF type:complete len:1024 (+),score=193.69 TRINITY_DN177_c1_g1_i1:107-3073(+)
MAGVSLSAVLTALCLALVAVSAGVSIGMSVSTGERTLSDTKAAGAEGLTKCFDKGTENVDSVARELMRRTVVEMGNQVRNYFSLPGTLASFLLYFVSRTDADVSTDPEWLEGTLIPVMSALVRHGAPGGVAGVNYIAMNIAMKALRLGVLGTSKWGGGIGIYSTSCSSQLYTNCLFKAMDAGEDPEEVCKEEATSAFDLNLGLEDFWISVSTMRDWETGRVGMNTTHIVTDEVAWDGQGSGKPCNTPDLLGRRADRQCFPQFGACPSPLDLSDAESAASGSQISDLGVIAARSFENALTGGELDAPNRLHWSPANTVSQRISTYIYFPVSHPDGLALFGPTVGPRVGYGFIEVHTGHITRQLRNMQRPTAGSRLYAVERNPWTGVTSTLTGASHGRTWSAGHDGTSWITLPMPVLNSSDPVIREHAQWSLSLPGGFEAAADMEDKTWPPGPQALHWALTERVSDNHGLLWYLSLVVPRAEVLRTINEATAEIRAEIGEKNDAVEADAERDFTVMVVIVCIASILLMIAGVSLAIQISSPLRLLDGEMSQVAAMNLEAVDERRPLSRLSEIGSMQESFLQMVRNLREYRSYMPASCLLTEEQEEEEAESVSVVDAPDGTEHRPSPACRLSVHHRSSARGSDASSLSRSCADSEDNRTVSPLKGKDSRVTFAKTAHAAVRKRVTLVVVNRRGFLHEMSRVAPRALSSFLSDEVTAFAQITQDRKGVVEMLSADHFSANFGAARILGAHRVAAVSAAAQFCGVVEPRFQKGAFQRRATMARDGTGASGESEWAALPLTSAVATGQALCGDFGSVSAGQRYMIMGSVLPLVMTLERIAAVWQSKVLTDHTAADDAAQVWHLRLRKRVLFRKHSTTPIGLWEVTDPREVGRGSQAEWMYELASADAPKWDPYNKAVSQWCYGDVQKARVMVHTSLEKGGCPADVADALHALEAQIAAAADPPQAEVPEDFGVGPPAAVQRDAEDSAPQPSDHQ